MPGSRTPVSPSITPAGSVGDSGDPGRAAESGGREAVTDQSNASAPPVPTLSRGSLAFGYLPSCYMHPSWWSPIWLPRDLYKRLTSNPRCHRHLSSFFLRQLGTEANWSVDVQCAADSLALANAQGLDRLVHLAGVTLHSRAIAGVLRSGQQRDIKRRIGIRSYEFALRRGRFLLQQVRLANAVSTVALTEVNTLKADCRALGLRALATAFSETPIAMVRRVQLRFCKSLIERHWRSLASEPADFLRLFFLIDRQVDVQ